MYRRASLIGLLVAVAFVSVPTPAQTARIAVTIPYDFTAGSRRLASGDYVITRAIPNDPRVFAFRGAAKHEKAVVMTSSKADGAAAVATELTFARYGDEYFLRSFRIHGDANLYSIKMSKEEKAAAAKGAEAVLVSLKAAT